MNHLDILNKSKIIKLCTINYKVKLHQEILQFNRNMKVMKRKVERMLKKLKLKEVVMSTQFFKQLSRMKMKFKLMKSIMKMSWFLRMKIVIYMIQIHLLMMKLNFHILLEKNNRKLSFSSNNSLRKVRKIRLQKRWEGFLFMIHMPN